MDSIINITIRLVWSKYINNPIMVVQREKKYYLLPHSDQKNPLEEVGI